MHKAQLTIGCFIVCCLKVLLVCGQVSGIVSDAGGEPLAFVNIYVQDSNLGTTTNEEGYYSLPLITDGDYELIYQFLGYEIQSRAIAYKGRPLAVNIVLNEGVTSLEEVTITSGVNPAERIIRGAIANRTRNLAKIEEYTAAFYSRGLWRVQNAPERILGRDLGDLGGGLDESRSGIIYLSETISSIAYQSPNNFREVIKASKVSGNDNGFSFNTAIDANFSFYNKTVDLNTSLLSPIGDEALTNYTYELEGVFYEEGQLINKIIVQPKRPKDRVFSGIIYIVEDNWQLYGVDLRTNGEIMQVPPVDQLRFRQSFRYNQQLDLWVKKSQLIDFSFKFLGLEGDGRFTAVYSDYNFSPSFDSSSFTNEVLSFKEKANKKDSLFWKNERPIPLSSEETLDYVKRDRLQTKRSSRAYLDSLDTVQNKLTLLSPFFGISRTNSFERSEWEFGGLVKEASFNTVQGWNLSPQLRFTSWSDENYQKTWYALAKANYSFSTDRVRFTARVTRRFDRVSRKTVSLSGGTTVLQINNSEPILPVVNTLATLGFKENYAKFYEKEFLEIGYRQEVFNGLTLTGILSYENRKPLYNSTDQTFFSWESKRYSSNNPLQPFNFAEAVLEEHQLYKVSLQAQVRLGQKYYSYPSGKFNIDNEAYPKIQIQYQKSFSGSAKQYHFDHLSMELSKDLNFGIKGMFQVLAIAGTFFNTAGTISFVDYKHFEGNETPIASSTNYLGRFNALPYYALSTNTSYLELHAEHHFQGWLLGKIPFLNRLNYNVVFGAHLLSQSKENTYREFSIGLENIGLGKYRFLRVDYVKSLGLENGHGRIVVGIQLLDFL